MKRFIIAVVFLVVLFSTCYLLVAHLQKNTIAIRDEINRLQYAVEIADQNSAVTAMKQLKDHWDEEKYLFHALAGSIYCDPFESSLERTAVWVEQKESSELFAELSELHSRIDQLWDTQALHPKNLF